MTEMLSGGLPAACWGPGPAARLPLPASGAHGLEKPQDRLAAAVALPVPSPSASSSGLALFCFKVAGFCLFVLSHFSLSSSSLCHVYFSPSTCPLHSIVAMLSLKKCDSHTECLESSAWLVLADMSKVSSNSSHL